MSDSQFFLCNAAPNRAIHHWRHDERVVRSSPGPAPSSPGANFPQLGKKLDALEHRFRWSSPWYPWDCRVECRQDVTTDKGTSALTAVKMKLAARKVPSGVEQGPQRHPVADSRPELTPQGGPLLSSIPPMPPGPPPTPAARRRTWIMTTTAFPTGWNTSWARRTDSPRIPPVVTAGAVRTHNS